MVPPLVLGCLFRGLGSSFAFSRCCFLAFVVLVGSCRQSILGGLSRFSCLPCLVVAAAAASFFSACSASASDVGPVGVCLYLNCPTPSSSFVVALDATLADVAGP